MTTPTPTPTPHPTTPTHTPPHSLPTLSILPCSNFFLRPENYASCNSLLVQRFGELVRKVWNSRAFKGQVSPHEFMQASWPSGHGGLPQAAGHSAALCALRS